MTRKVAIRVEAVVVGLVLLMALLTLDWGLGVLGGIAACSVRWAEALKG